MTDFTPVQALIGGGLIGLAAVLLMAFNGRIAGATGILGGLLPPGIARDWAWRAAFIIGMIASPLLYHLLGRGGIALFAGPIPFTPVSTTTMSIVGGLLVGVGVTYGSGCTSGHGVCGLARLSPRSMVAVPVFMATTALAVFVVRHVLGG